MILLLKTYRLSYWGLKVFSLECKALERSFAGAQESRLRVFHLVWNDGRSLLIGDTDQVYGPFDHPARGARYRPRRFCRTQQGGTHRFSHIVNHCSCIRQSEGAVDAVFGIDSDTPRAIGLASATACREIATDSGRCRTGAIHAPWNLLGPGATQAPVTPLSGLQITAGNGPSPHVAGSIRTRCASMPLMILSVIVQIALIVHAVRTGRSPYWVFIILLVPGIGSLAYFIVELLPELTGDHRTRRAYRGIKKTLNPGADLRQRQREHRLSGSVDAARHLASELIASGNFAEAIEHYEKALTGLYEDDPDLLLGLAHAQFANKDYEKSKQTLEGLIERNPDFRSPEGHLLYARAAEQCEDLTLAETEYKTVAAYYAGAEAKVRYAALLERVDKNDDALEAYEDIVNIAELAPRHYRKAQKRWISQARDAVSRLRK